MLHSPALQAHSQVRPVPRRALHANLLLPDHTRHREVRRHPCASQDRLPLQRARPLARCVLEELTKISRARPHAIHVCQVITVLRAQHPRGHARQGRIVELLVERMHLIASASRQAFIRRKEARYQNHVQASFLPTRALGGLQIP